jgi:hypothetical protein
MNQDVSTWSYRPGDWLAIFGAATTLLLPASEKARAAQLWDQVDGGAGFAATLDEVLAPGLSVLPAFVLIGTEEGPTKVIVRGAGVRAVLTTEEGTVELDGSSVTTWVEQSLDGVSAISVAVGEAGDGSGSARDHLIEGGLVRVGRVDWPARVAEAAPAPVAAPAFAVPADTGVSTPEEAEPPETELLDVAAYDPDAEDGDTTDVPSLGISLMEDPEPEPEGEESEFVWADEGGADAGGADVGGANVAGLPLPPPPVTGVPLPPADATIPPAASAPPASDHDGLTHAGASTGEFEREKPGIPGQPPAPNVTRPVARLVVSNGDTVEVDRVVLIGRAPEARRFTATEQPRLVTVPSPLHEISSTHVEVRPGTGADHGSAVVTDMGSTNGTVLVQPGLGPEDLKPGIAVQLIPGAIINLGDGVTIQVTNP